MTLSILTFIYITVTLLLAIYALNAWVMTILYLKHRPTSLDLPPHPQETWDDSPAFALPSVTVQLPIFNEALVVERLIGAIVKLDYPADRLQIQVLDDSTDETTQLASVWVEHYRQQGLNIELIHRQTRPGFKAGALKQAMAQATGEFIAIFDADFVPQPDFLRHTIPHFTNNPQLGFVQTRWGHLNRDYSWLTAAQALALDGHFVIEQTARNRSGLMMNFNGTAGLWRRSCIEAAGGWQADTISEDFDLSYRAQLGGWKCLYLPHIVAPAEIPPQLAAFKRQQFRWAKGSIQCLKKLGWQVLRSDSNPWVKYQALVHLSSYTLHPLMTILALIIPMFMLYGGHNQIRFPLVYLSLLSFGPPLLFAIAQASIQPQRWLRSYRVMPLLILLGSGIALSNSKAFIEAVLGRGNVFRRTPKFNVVSTQDHWQQSTYRLPLDWLVVGELALSLYSFYGAWLALTNGNGFAVPFILMYAFSFGYVGVQGIWDARRSWLGWFGAQFQGPNAAPSTKTGRRKPIVSSR